MTPSPESSTLEPAASPLQQGDCLRVEILAREADHLLCKPLPAGAPLRVYIPRQQRSLAAAAAGMQANLLNYTFVADDAVQPALFVLDPDYLVDVSALAAAHRPYGATAEGYLLSRFTPREDSLPILLGGVANRFMDVCMGSHPQYAEAMQSEFADNALVYVCRTDEIPRSFFDKAAQHFAHIRDTVATRFTRGDVGLTPADSLLEPAFLCERLGLRGRFDVMRLDARCLIELKSGRAEGFGSAPPRPRREHLVQTALYKEILHYNLGLPRDQVRAYLFYSLYPALFDEHVGMTTVRAALDLRNEIVALEAQLRAGHLDEILPRLTPEALNTAHLSGRFWETALRPALERACAPLQAMDARLRAYVCAFAAFAAREQHIAATGVMRADGNYGFAAAWRASAGEKLATGDMLCDLTLLREEADEGDQGIARLVLQRPAREAAGGGAALANFSAGELVMLYARDAAADTATTQLVTRAYIEVLTPDSLVLRLYTPQRNRNLFSRAVRYAVEHDSAASLHTAAFRALGALACAPAGRRALLLAQRPPHCTAGRALRGAYPPEVAEIVARDKATDDFFLLVGPPGTGKTSIALRALVAEFLLDYAAGCAVGEAQPRALPEGLLLTAYTNRAVDEICATLDALFAPYVRIGVETTCGEAFRPRLLSTYARRHPSRAALRAHLEATPIVVGTLATLSGHTELFRLRRYRAIVDEASQVLEPQILSLLCAEGAEPGTCGITRFTLIGDHKQLPAVVQQAAEERQTTHPELVAMGITDLGTSLFERLHRWCTISGHADLVYMLTRTGRMHRDICAAASQLFYASRLAVVGLPHQGAQSEFTQCTTPLERFIAASRLGFVNVQPAVLPPLPKANADEARAAAQLVAALCRLAQRNGAALDVARCVGVIVPYRAQIAAVRAALAEAGVPRAEEITIDTVECYQGSQRDYILFLATVSRPYQLPQLGATACVEGEAVDRRLNVALTRARLRFFLLGNARLLTRLPLYAALIARSRRVEFP